MLIILGCTKCKRILLISDVEKEAVVVLGISELPGDDAEPRGTQQRAVDGMGCFGQTADVQVNIVHRSVSFLQIFYCLIIIK